MRKFASILWWLLVAVWIALDWLAQIHTLPADLQDFWDKRMSGLSPFAHLILVLSMIVLVYLYWPLLRRMMPFPPSTPTPWQPIADAAARFYSMLSQEPALVRAKEIFEIESRANQQDGPVWALRKYIWDYASNPILEVRGYVKGGASLVSLPKIEEDAVKQWIWDSDVHANPESNANEIVLPNGQEIISLEVSYTSVNRMIDHLKGQAMKNLRDARKSDAIDDFVKEHEADPDGDLDKLDALIKRPTQGTAKATRKASTQAPSDD